MANSGGILSTSVIGIDHRINSSNFRAVMSDRDSEFLYNPDLYFEFDLVDWIKLINLIFIHLWSGSTYIPSLRIERRNSLDWRFNSHMDGTLIRAYHQLISLFWFRAWRHYENRSADRFAQDEQQVTFSLELWWIGGCRIVLIRWVHLSLRIAHVHSHRLLLHLLLLLRRNRGSFFLHEKDNEHYDPNQ